MWSNTAEERARHMINMLNDTNIKAIIQVKGGSCANDVAHFLDQYDRAPKATEEKITKAWEENHEGQKLPEDFFKPRLDPSYYTDSSGKEHGLPKRGIPHIGFSDVSVINNLLGQRGVARPYYSTNIDMASPEQFTDLKSMLTEERPVRTYEGMVLASPKAKVLLVKELLIYATLDLRMSSSVGTGYEFHLDGPEPYILAVESIDRLDMGRMLQQARSLFYTCLSARKD